MLVRQKQLNPGQGRIRAMGLCDITQSLVVNADAGICFYQGDDENHRVDAPSNTGFHSMACGGEYVGFSCNQFMQVWKVDQETLSSGSSTVRGWKPVFKHHLGPDCVLPNDDMDGLVPRHAMSFSKDAGMLVTSFLSTIILWDVQNNDHSFRKRWQVTIKPESRDATFWITSLLFIRANSSVFAGCMDGTVYGIHDNDGSIRSQFCHPSTSVLSLSLSMDEKYLVTGLSDSTHIGLWKLKDASFQSLANPEKKSQDYATHSAVHVSSLGETLRILCTFGSERLHVLDEKGELQFSSTRFKDHPENITSLLVVDETRVFTGSLDGTICQWNRTNTPLPPAPEPANNSLTSSVPTPPVLKTAACAATTTTALHVTDANLVPVRAHDANAPVTDGDNGATSACAPVVGPGVLAPLDLARCVLPSNQLAAETSIQTKAMAAIREWLICVYVGPIVEEMTKTVDKTMHWHCTILNHALACYCPLEDRTKMHLRCEMVQKGYETSRGRRAMLAIRARLLCASCNWSEAIEHLDYIAKQVPIHLDWSRFDLASSSIAKTSPTA